MLLNKNNEELFYTEKFLNIYLEILSLLSNIKKVNEQNILLIYDEIKIFNVSLSHDEIIESFYSSFATTTTSTTITTTTITSTTTTTTTTSSTFHKYNNINNRFTTSTSTHSNKTFIQNYGNIFIGNDNNKFNKNIVLLSLREMTNLSTKEIRAYLKKYKILYLNTIRRINNN
jgi:hypothetical protein